MSSLAFPAHVAIKVFIWENGSRQPYRGRPIAFDVRTFARTKNDYHLGPFFSDEHGEVRLSRRTLDLFARATLSGGLMDYASIHDAFSFIEIVHLSADEVDRIVRARTTGWTTPREGELELYGSTSALVERLRHSGNRSLRPPAPNYGRLRDEWVDSSRELAYEYTVQRV